MKETLIRTSFKKGLLKIYLYFAVFLLAIFTLTTIPLFRKTMIEPLNNFLAWSSASMLRALGQKNVESTGENIHGPIFRVQIQEGCNGIYAISIFWAAIIVYPTGWRNKVLGVGLGTIILFSLNYARILTLWYAGIYAPSFFEPLHVYVWDVTIIVAGIFLWLIWYERWVAKAKTP